MTLLAGLAFGSNGLTLGVISFALPGLRESWGLTPAQAGALVMASGTGQLVGSLLIGYVADSMGRRAGYGLAFMFIAGYALQLSHQTLFVVLGLLLIANDGRVDARERTGRGVPVRLPDHPAVEPSGTS